MNKNYFTSVITTISAFFIMNAIAQSSSDGMWIKIPAKEILGAKVNRSSFPSEYHLFQLN